MIDDFSYKGDYGYLSNFYMHPVSYNNIQYPSSEHAYQAAKVAEGYHNDIRLKIASDPLLKQPGEVKKYGQTVPLRYDWEIIKNTEMLNILRIKFSDDVLGQKLISTYPHLLVEGNYWHDNYWGNCYCDKCRNIPGLDMLGILLMQVRHEKGIFLK